MLLLEMMYDRRAPVPAQRTNSNGTRHYTPMGYADYKKALVSAIKSEYAFLRQGVPTDGADRKNYLRDNRFLITIRVYRHAQAGDSDNFTKTVKDAIEQSGIIGNDCQIECDNCFKLIDKGQPRIEFSLLKIPADHQKQNAMAMDIEMAVKNIVERYNRSDD